STVPARRTIVHQKRGGSTTCNRQRGSGPVRSGRTSAWISWRFDGCRREPDFVAATPYLEVGGITLRVADSQQVELLPQGLVGIETAVRRVTPGIMAGLADLRPCIGQIERIAGDKVAT